VPFQHTPGKLAQFKSERKLAQGAQGRIASETRNSTYKHFPHVQEIPVLLQAGPIDRLQDPAITSPAAQKQAMVPPTMPRQSGRSPSIHQAKGMTATGVIAVTA